MWPTTQNFSLSRMSSRIRSIIFGWGFIHQPRLFSRARIGFLEFLDYLEDSVAPHHGVVDDEFEGRSVFEDDGSAHQALNALAMDNQQVHPALFLLAIPQHPTKAHLPI